MERGQRICWPWDGGERPWVAGWGVSDGPGGFSGEGSSGRCGTLWLLIPWQGRKRVREAGVCPSTQEQHWALWEPARFPW